MITVRRWATVSAAILVAACAAQEGTPPPSPGSPAPPLAAATLAGDTVTLEGLQGKVVLLNMWATWCGPCRAETPYLQELYETYGEEGLEVVGVSMDTRNAADAVEMFVDEFDVTYTILHDPLMRGMDTYRVVGLPATFLIDRDGTLRWMMYGPVSETSTSFHQALEDALSVER